MRRRREAEWTGAYEDLRAAALAGTPPLDADAGLRLARLGVGGLAWPHLPVGWEVVVRQAPESRWSGTDARLVALQDAYRIANEGGSL